MEKRSSELTPWPNGRGYDHEGWELTKPRPEVPHSSWVARLFRGADLVKIGAGETWEEAKANARPADARGGGVAPRRLAEGDRP